MNLLVVPKPIFDSEMTVEGYYFLYQYGNAILENAKSNPLDGAMHSPFLEFINAVGLETLTQNKLIFVPVTQILLMTDLERENKIEPGKIALLLNQDIRFNEATLARLVRFSNLGFKIAFQQPEDLSRLLPYLDFADYVFLSMSTDELLFKQQYLLTHFNKVTLVATGIESGPAFETVKNSGVRLFGGPFYKVQVGFKHQPNNISPLKVNYIQLLNIVNQEDFDIQSFTHIIRQDTALAIQFMRLINSSSRVNAEIRNFNQAAALLGQREIKKWVATAASTALCADRPSEITRVSLLRAKFCENMARYFEMAIAQDNLFLTGLFSVLDVVLEKPMKEALTLVSVPEPVHKALSEGKGNFYEVLSFVISYEQGDWHEVSRLALLKHIPIPQIHKAYVDALQWCGDLTNSTK